MTLKTKDMIILTFIDIMADDHGFRHITLNHNVRYTSLDYDCSLSRDLMSKIQRGDYNNIIV